MLALLIFASCSIKDPKFPKDQKGIKEGEFGQVINSKGTIEILVYPRPAASSVAYNLLQNLTPKKIKEIIDMYEEIKETEGSDDPDVQFYIDTIVNTLKKVYRGSGLDNSDQLANIASTTKELLIYVVENVKDDKKALDFSKLPHQVKVTIFSNPLENVEMLKLMNNPQKIKKMKNKLVQSKRKIQENEILTRVPIKGGDITSKVSSLVVYRAQLFITEAKLKANLITLLEYSEIIKSGQSLDKETRLFMDSLSHHSIYGENNSFQLINQIHFSVLLVRDSPSEDEHASGVEFGNELVTIKAKGLQSSFKYDEIGERLTIYSPEEPVVFTLNEGVKSIPNITYSFQSIYYTYEQLIFETLLWSGTEGNKLLESQHKKQIKKASIAFEGKWSELEKPANIIIEAKDPNSITTSGDTSKITISKKELSNPDIWSSGNDGSGGSKLTKGAIAGIAVGCVVVVAIVIGIIVFVVLRKNKKDSSASKS